VRIRPFQTDDAPALAALSAVGARTESDFVLNPLWESEEELFAEFDHLEIDPEDHVLVAEGEAEQPIGMVGFLRRPHDPLAGLLAPLVEKRERGRGLGGELLRAAMARATELGVKLVSAGIGSRNRAGYSLLAGFGFRPLRQHFLMRCTARPKHLRPPVPGLEFGLARAGDAAAILEIYAACGFEARSPERMQLLLAGRRHRHAVARQHGRVVAFAELETHWPQRPWVAFVGVAGALRDRGVGSALVAWALEREFEAGARAALLLLSPANRTALRAYEKVGFRRHRTVDVLEKEI
jgi:ribosomal protein S18 acetylase RimI-like enzyme